MYVRTSEFVSVRKGGKERQLNFLHEQSYTDKGKNEIERGEERGREGEREKEKEGEERGREDNLLSLYFPPEVKWPYLRT